MPYRTIIALRESVGARFPDNTAGLIVPMNVRDMFKDMIDTFGPGYGIVGTDALTLPALGLTPQIVTYDALLAETDHYLGIPVSGTITRFARGLPSTVNRVSFYADVSAPTGDEVVFSLFRDGMDIPGGGTVSGQGLGNVVQVAFSISTTAEDDLDHSYDIRAFKVTGGADNVELANVRFIIEYIPTIGI
jgi:hypothetical protein